MSYIKHMLLPGEQVLYEGHVHPRVLVHGVVWLAVAAFVLTEGRNTGGGHSFVLNTLYSLSGSFPSLRKLYELMWSWQANSPNVALEIKLIGLGLALYGLHSLIMNFMTMQTTELVVTTSRIIAKTGIFAIVTIEMDKRRVAEVSVFQTMWGRVMGYGNIAIHGFTNSIVGLPVMANPHLVEQFVS